MRDGICPECGCGLNLKNLSKHVRKVHGRSLSDVRKFWVLCPKCGQKMKRRKLRIHLRDVHNQGVPAQPYWKKPKPAVGLARCAGCFREMREDKLSKHQQECASYIALRKKRRGQKSKDASNRKPIDPTRKRVRRCSFCDERAMSGSDVCYQCSRE
jgi:hypothetical protein